MNREDTQEIAEWNTTGEQLIAYFGDHEIRSHRAPRRPIFTQRRIAVGLTALVAVTTLNSASYNVPAEQTTHIALSPSGINEDTSILPEQSITKLTSPEKTPDEIRQSRASDAVSRDKRATPSVSATRWVKPLSSIRVTSCYGSRNGSQHMGIDFGASTGTPIVSVGAGKVVQAGWGYSGLGNSVVIDHGSGQMTLYGHASKVLVRIGQQVSAGSRIALVGSTGHSTGPHLHFGFANTKSVGELFGSLTNPAPWLKSRGLPTGRC